MSVVVYLMSGVNGEIKEFLQRFYQKEVEIDNDVGKWIYVYNKPVDAVDVISAVVDNNNNFKISICIQIDDGDIYHVNNSNCDDIIRGIFELFYNEIPLEAPLVVC
jgi:hypothetical protein